MYREKLHRSRRGDKWFPYRSGGKKSILSGEMITLPRLFDLDGPCLPRLDDIYLSFAGSSCRTRSGGIRYSNPVPLIPLWINTITRTRRETCDDGFFESLWFCIEVIVWKWQMIFNWIRIAKTCFEENAGGNDYETRRGEEPRLLERTIDPAGPVFRYRGAARPRTHKWFP